MVEVRRGEVQLGSGRGEWYGQTKLGMIMVQIIQRGEKNGAEGWRV